MCHHYSGFREGHSQGSESKNKGGQEIFDMTHLALLNKDFPRLIYHSVLWAGSQSRTLLFICVLFVFHFPISPPS